jgi:hypothetical protein
MDGSATPRITGNYEDKIRKDESMSCLWIVLMVVICVLIELWIDKDDGR